MPELPEVETIRRQLAPVIAGRSVLDAWSFGTAKFDEAVDAIGASVVDLRRRGKYLLAGLGRGGSDAVGRPPSSELVVHLGMTGRLAVVASGPPQPHPHLRAWWQLDDGSTLTFHDARRFGRVAVVEAGRYERLPTLAALGPEPDDEAFEPERLRQAVNTGGRRVKTALLSQRPVAGVGNIYADEALWRAGVHPGARRLGRASATRLRDSIRMVIDESIDRGGTTLRDYRDARGAAGTNQRHLDCYGRGGEPCRRCGTVLRRTTVDGRGTTWCPTCQRR